MRTKTLLLTAALGLVGSASMMAQVYSQNAVGYVNVAMKPGLNLVANPLDAGAGNNTVLNLFKGVPNGAIVYKFNGAGFDINTYAGGWDDDTMALAPGDGFFFKNPGNADYAVTFVGEVVQGAQTTSVPAGLALLGSKWPAAGNLSENLSFPAGKNGDRIYLWNGSGYDIFTFAGGWDTDDGKSPAVGVAQGFWSNLKAAATWSQNFSVNN